NYRDRVVDRKVDADERKAEQICFSGQSARQQSSNQRRRAAFVPKESGRCKHLQLRRQTEARPRTAWPTRALEESDRDARGRREDRARLILWRSKVIARSRRSSVSNKRRPSMRSRNGLRRKVCSSRRKNPAAGIITDG